MKTVLHLHLLTVIFLLVTSNMSSQTVYKIQNQGITSETHRNNIGKILWAKERIQFKNQDGISYATEFNQGDAIYGRGYLEDCLYNLSIDSGNNDCLNPNNEFELRLLVNGEGFGKLYENYFPDQDWTTFQVTLALSDGDREDRINKGISAKWATVANKLAIGKYDITIEFWGGKPGCELIKYAEGSFVFNKTSGESVSGSGEKVPPHKMLNPKLSKEMIEEVKAEGWKNESPIYVVIIEPDWRIIRDAWGKITAREINTFVILKDNDGNCRANDISFRQFYNGKKYGNTRFYGLGLRSIPVNCTDYQK